jgi:uncharacterized membrane protein (DUF106 family)
VEIMSIYDAILEPIYRALDIAFGWLFAYGSMYAILGVAIVIGTTLTVVQALLVDQKELKMMREETTAFQKEMLNAQKSNDKNRIKKLQKRKGRIDEMQKKLMSMSFKPLYITMIPIFIFFSWLRQSPAADIVDPVVVKLPFDTLLVQLFHKSSPAGLQTGDWLGWLGWYIFSSSVVSNILRKIMGMA